MSTTTVKPKGSLILSNTTLNKRYKFNIQAKEFPTPAKTPVQTRLGQYRPSSQYIKMRQRFISQEHITNRQTIKSQHDFKKLFVQEVAVPKLLFTLINHLKVKDVSTPARARRA